MWRSPSPEVLGPELEQRGRRVLLPLALRVLVAALGASPASDAPAVQLCAALRCATAPAIHAEHGAANNLAA